VGGGGAEENLKWMENNKSLSTRRIMEKFCTVDDAERKERETRHGRPCARRHMFALKPDPVFCFQFDSLCSKTKTLSVYSSKHLNINTISVSRDDSLY
jgi:hypothetical protein